MLTHRAVAGHDWHDNGAIWHIVGSCQRQHTTGTEFRGSVSSKVLKAARWTVPLDAAKEQASSVNPASAKAAKTGISTDRMKVRLELLNHSALSLGFLASVCNIYKGGCSLVTDEGKESKQTFSLGPQSGKESLAWTVCSGVVLQCHLWLMHLKPKQHKQTSDLAEPLQSKM